jgi:phage-related protein
MAASSNTFGGTIKLEGESEYKKALQNCTNGLKLLGSELKLATTEFNNNGKTVGDLRAKNDLLNKKVEEQQKVIKTCSDAVKNFSDQQDKNKSIIEQLKQKLDEEKQSLEKMRNSTTSTTSEIEKQENVVANLAKELKNAETTYDNNSRKINDYKVKINNAQTEVSNLSKEINGNNEILSKYKDNAKTNAKAIKEFATEEDKAGNSTLSLADIIKGNLISEGIIAGIKGLASAAKTVGSTLLNVGKEALSSYADYEQLVGGVETLFKDSAGVVENYANNAYKTSGLSANDYMETVTSFSASLLSSLNNDTTKSAEVADMAITDMSDNANKMGTSMESIQNAYQGFAKQNYTMLDNLKLGYGGTKSEMERLLKDAQKISGVKYDINNLSDVYNAIHVIQGELDITGTTAKEASTTIRGSAAAAKSAWQNLLTGVADDNADWGTLVQNFVNSVSVAAENILPRISTIVEGIGLLITDVLGMLLSKMVPMGVDLIQNLITGMTDMLPDILTSLNVAIGVILNGFLSMLPQILQLGIQVIVSLAQGLAQQLPTLIPQIVDAVIMMVNTLLDNIDLIIDAGIQLIIGLAQGLINALPQLIDRLPEIIDKIVTTLANNVPKLVEAGIQLTVMLAVGLVKAIPQLISKIPQIVHSMLTAYRSYLNNFSDIGSNIIKGIADGFNKAKNYITNKIKAVVNNIKDGFKKLLGIHSPSTWARDMLGVNLAKGIGIGFVSEMNEVQKQMNDALPTDFNVVPKVTTGFKVARYDAMSDDVDDSNRGDFNVTINNNSKYTSPSENVRLMRQEYELYKLKYGKRRLA